MAFFLLCTSIFIMFLQPVFIWPWMEPLQPLRNSAILALFAYLFTKDKSDKPFLKDKTNLFFVLFVIMQIISASVKWISGGLEMFNFWLKMGIVYFLVVKSVINENRVKWIILSMVAGIAYLSYYSLSTYVFNYYPGVRAGGFGFYENGNDLSIILVTMIPLLFYLANSSKSLIVKYFYIIVAGILSFNILFTGSRNGLLGLITVGLLSILFSVKVSKLIRMGIFVVLIVSVLTIGLTNILSRSDLGGALTGDASSENRIDQWKAAISMTRHNPVFGVGPGNFTDEAENYGGMRSMMPHNSILQVFAESGILGGILFLLFSFYPFYNYFKGSYSSLEYKFLLTSMSGFWVCAFFSNRYQFYILYVLVALIISNSNNESRDNGHNSK